MFQESNRWIVLGVALLLAACGTEQAGEGAGDNTTGNTQDVGTDTTNGDTQTDEPSQDDTDSTDAGTQTDDESTDTSDAGTQTDDESTDTNDAGTQTDDESTDTSDAGTQTDDESTDTSDAGTQTDDDSTDTSDNTDSEDDANTDDTEVEDEGHDLNGKWEGSYTCSQGFTRLTLQVTHDTGSNTLDAVFAFYADNSNPDVPTGRYTMLGSYSPDTLSVVLEQGEWIEQPSGYVMVSLDGFINEEGTAIAGTVDNLGCTEFTVERGN